jgi:hypothetical protein
VTERKQVHEKARQMIARKIAELLDERDAHGKKKITQARLGELLGVSQEAARRAREPNGVTPAIVNGMSRAFNFHVLANERVETVRTNDDGTKTKTVSFPTLLFDEEHVPGFDEPIFGGPPHITTRVVDRSDLERAKEIARHVAQAGKHTYEQALAAAGETYMKDGSDLAWLAATERKLGADRPKSGTDHAPISPHDPSNPPVRKLKGKR